MIMACLAAITIVIKAERNDGGSPKGMAGISNKRLKQYSAGASEQHEGCDGTLLGVRGVPPKEMLLQNQREATVSTEIASELSRIWLGSEKLARKHGLVLNERGYVGSPSPPWPIFPPRASPQYRQRQHCMRACSDTAYGSACEGSFQCQGHERTIRVQICSVVVQDCP